MRPLALIRPEPGWSRSAAAAQELGLEVIGEPLFVIEPVDWSAPPRDEVDALLLGSANALRHAGEGIAAYRGLPAYAVGEATADAARLGGLDVVAIGGDDLQSLAGDIDARHRRLLRLCGREKTAFAAPSDTKVIECVTYAAEKRPIGDAFAAMLGDGAVVALHSPRAARHFASECDRLGLDRLRIALAMLSRRVGEAAGQGWGQIACATEPTDAALLATAKTLCQTT